MSYKGKNGAPLDLVLLNELTEEAVVSTLNKNYTGDNMYTYIGPVLISVNPYRDLGIYSDKMLKKFVGKREFENKPHVYAVAERAYRSMTVNLSNECVVITGESGSGKTENSKKVMEYVAAMASKSKQVQTVKEQLLESNPLLEAFGNAKTVRNDNSSRFGKYMEILFTYGDPSGGRITVYLLEKSRVVHQGSGERNFHAFYQLLSSSAASKYGLSSASDYEYTKTCTSVDNMNDSKEFKDTVRAMEFCGIDSKEQDDVWSIVATILKLGNASVSGNDDSSSVSNHEDAASSLGVSAAALKKALTTATIETRGDKVVKNLSASDATATRDALAKSLYGKLFLWIVREANNTIRTEKFSSSIGVLDIYGFEILGTNGFEQLCINFTNEKLHQLFIELTLKSEQAEYASEGIPWEDVDYYDNMVVCDLVERNRGGMFALLNEESIFPNGSDESLFSKLNSQLRSSADKELFSVPAKSAEISFEIKHYAGQVRYTTKGMLEKNKDLLSNDLKDCISTSSNDIAKILFSDETLSSETGATANSHKSKRPDTTCVQYKKSMNELMTTLKAASQHYIRCIKPNDSKSPGVFTDKLCVSQARYLGILENVKVRRAGYAFRMDYETFAAKYKCVQKGHSEWGVPAKDKTKKIMDSAKVKDFQMGKSKVFIKSPNSLFALEDARRKFLDMARSYMPEGDGVVHADKVFSFNKQMTRAPLMFIVGGEGLYLFHLKGEEITGGTAAHYFPLNEVESFTYNPSDGWVMLTTKEYPGEFEDDPKIRVMHLIENLGGETEEWVETLNTGMGHSIKLVKASGTPPSLASDPAQYTENRSKIGAGAERPPPPPAVPVKQPKKGGCSIA